MVGPVLTKCFCHCKLTVRIPSDTYSLANWPIVNVEAEDARQEMLRAKAHEVVPLPAYDIKGNLIKSEKYRVALAGALARVTFTMATCILRQPKNQPTVSWLMSKRLRC